MSDSIRILCPNLQCRVLLSVPEAARGKSVKCRQCGTRVRIPFKANNPAPTPAQSDQDQPKDAPESTDETVATNDA